MEQLVKMVSQQAGISEEQAETAVTTVLRFLKDRLPAPIAGQVEKVLVSGDDSAADDLSDQVGKLFGGS